MIYLDPVSDLPRYDLGKPPTPINSNGRKIWNRRDDFDLTAI
jgi:hypothetical protein